jgi:hypothetical protein
MKWTDLASLASVVGALAGAAWVIYKFFIFTESFPKLTFNVNLETRAAHQDCHICEVVAEIENVGNVRVEITAMSFALHGLKESDPIDESDPAINFQMMFPHPVKSADWFPKSWESSFVETKTKQVYRYICSVPKEYKAVVVHGKVHYLDTYHSANRLVALSS